MPLTVMERVELILRQRGYDKYAADNAVFQETLDDLERGIEQALGDAVRQ